MFLKELYSIFRVLLKLKDMKTTHCILMREDNKKIKYNLSKFERQVGDIMKIDGYRWRVIIVGENKHYVIGEANLHGSNIWNDFKF